MLFIEVFSVSAKAKEETTVSACALKAPFTSSIDTESLDEMTVAAVK